MSSLSDGTQYTSRMVNGTKVYKVTASPNSAYKNALGKELDERNFDNLLGGKSYSFWTAPAPAPTSGSTYHTQSTGGTSSPPINQYGGVNGGYGPPTPPTQTTTSQPTASGAMSPGYTSGSSQFDYAYLNPNAQAPKPTLPTSQQAPTLSNPMKSQSQAAGVANPYEGGYTGAMKTKMDDEDARLHAENRDAIRNNGGAMSSGFSKMANFQNDLAFAGQRAANYNTALTDSAEKGAAFGLQKGAMLDNYDTSRAQADLAFANHNLGAMKQNALLPYDVEGASLGLLRQGQLLPYEIRGAELANRGEQQRQTYNANDHDFAIEQQPYQRQQWAKQIHLMDKQIQSYEDAIKKGDFAAAAQIGGAIGNILAALRPQGGQVAGNFNSGAVGPYTMNAKTAGAPTGVGGYSAPLSGASAYGAPGGAGNVEDHTTYWDLPFGLNTPWMTYQPRKK